MPVNPGQQKFFDFIMERVKTGKEEGARDLLDEAFTKQANGTFNAEYIRSFAPRMIALLKPECVDEVKAITGQFGRNLNRP